MNLINERIIKRLTVKITSTAAREAGSGFLLSQSHLEDKIYVLTAKHCLCGSEFEHVPNYKSLFLEMSVGDSVVKYEFQEDDQIIFHEANDPDVAIVVIDKEKLDNEVIKIPLMDAVTDRSKLQGCVFGGFPNEFYQNTLKSILCSFDLTADENTIELSPQSRIESVEFDNNLSSIRGMSGGAVLLENNGDIFLHGIVDTFGGWQRFTGTTLGVVNNLLNKNSLKEIALTKLELDENVVSAVSQLAAVTSEEITRRQHKNKIGDLHLDRSALISDAELALNNSRMVVIHGAAGVGKSVIASELLVEQQKSRSIFVFRSDELLGVTLTSFLANKGVDRTLEQIMDSPVLLKEKIIYIDAVENILEAHSFEAIESILSLSTQRKDLKILISIRSRYSNQLTALLEPSMPDKKTYIEVPFLTDDEIEAIKSRYNWVGQLFENPNLGELLKTPFYLNHTISLSDAILSDGEISKRNLIIRLWKKIVVSTNPYREQAFQKIVVDRAKAMKPYIKPRFIDNVAQLMEAVTNLYTDEVVLSDEDEYGDSYYAPSHDIFQDWALIRHVNDLRSSLPELSPFLKELGNELAIRRGFRLWMSDQLDLERFDKITNEFVLPTNSDDRELIYWKDEIVLSLLKSEHLKSFFNSCREQLLEDNAALFKRFTRLLLIASNPLSSLAEKDEEVAIDSQIENAWQVIVQFLSENYSNIEIEFDWLISLFKGWINRAKIKLYGNDSNSSLNNLCKTIMLTHETSLSADNEVDRKVLLDTFIYSSSNSDTELEGLVDAAIEFEAADEKFRQEKWNDPEKTNRPTTSHDLKSYFKDILKMIHSGRDSVGLCYLFPDKILAYMQSHWKENDSELLVANRSSYRRDSLESQFGLSHKSEFKYFPASPYQTPVLNLLRFYPFKTIKSICELLNYTSKKYEKNKSQYRNDEVVKIHLTYYGQVKQLIGSHTLWSIFRGTVQTSPYLLQSLLMAVEKYFLTLIKKRDDVSRLHLDKALKLIYESSTCVSPFAVVASVGMAHEKPVTISKFILPLFTAKELFYWDIGRFTGESTALAPMGDTEIIQLERHESNQLPHRKEYLETFLLRLSLTTILFGEITSILDRHYEERKVDNDNWSLALNRMDARKLELIERPSKNQIELKPRLDKSLEEKVKKYEEESSKTVAAMTALNWTHSIISKGDLSSNDYDTWKFYFNSVQRVEKDGMFDANPGVAYIGLKFHFETMTEHEIDACVKIILEHAVKTIQRDEFGECRISNSGTLNKEPVLLALPELFKTNSIKADELKEILTYAVFGMDLSNGVDVKIFEKLGEGLWQNNPNFAKAVSRGLYAIRELRDQRPKIGYNTHSRDQKALVSAYKEKADSFFDRVVKIEIEGVDLSSLTLDLNRLELLNSMVLFTPNDVPLDKEQKDFFVAYSRLLQESTLIMDQGRDSEHHKIVMARYAYQEKLAKILLGQPKEICESLFFDVFDFVSDGKMSFNQRLTWKLLVFMEDCLKAIIHEQDKREEGGNDSFWIVWNTFNKWQQERVPFFTGKLLLDIAWKDTAYTWKPIEGKGQFFINVIEESTGKLEGYIVKLLSRIGFEELGVELISKVASLVKENGVGNVSLQDLELWMQKLFALRRKDVVGDSQILDDVLYLLNEMVELGSSVGFHIRDVLLSYQKRLT